MEAMFKVGDEVVSNLYGVGVVTQVLENSRYPILVRFYRSRATSTAYGPQGEHIVYSVNPDLDLRPYRQPPPVVTTERTALEKDSSVTSTRRSSTTSTGILPGLGMIIGASLID